ncbi:MAG: hypothetical protein ACOYMG_02160 [Candidatus Methylumidiphilus sp.]
MMPNRTIAERLTVPQLPPTGQLLLDGGDDRIALNPETGLNKYGCGPLPSQRLLAFGSSTASTISEQAFAAAGNLRDRLLGDLSSSSCEAVYRRELQRVRWELLALCGLDKLPGIEVAIAASGTDLHSLVARMVRRHVSSRTCIIMMDPDETGCGIQAALGNQYPYPVQSVRDGDDGLSLFSVRLRRTDGKPRPQTEVDGEVETLANHAVRQGRRVLLIQLDVSKTGLLAPSLACIDRLQRQFEDRLDVLVDACQFRIAPASLSAYLRRGCMVAITGSKFLGGPSFSAALLMPCEVAGRFRRSALPSDGMACCMPAEWPSSWRAAGRFKCVPNFGLLLRWEAALAEFRDFSAVQEEHVVAFLQTFADAIQRRLTDDPAFEPLSVLPVERQPTASQNAWDSFPTIFPFLVFRTPSTLPLNRAEIARVYRSLLLGSSQSSDQICCQMGQPVACGFRDETPVAALRLCLSARLIVEGTADAGRHATSVIDRAMQALDKAKWLAEHRPDSS